MRKIKVAATQMAVTWDREQTLKNAEQLVRDAAKDGANIILLQELFETPYFCQRQDFQYFNLATTLEDNPAIKRMKEVAAELHVVLPISFYEKCGNTQFNSIAVINSDGTILGIYRKTHIPDGLPYAEKFYFTPGDTGFKVFQSEFGCLGIGICWDQWFPEAARAMALLGAEILFYPTAIGSEPYLHKDSCPHWQNTIKGHSGANMIPIVVSNRIGTEIDGTEMTFYGSSFICDQHGEIISKMDKTSPGYICVVIHNVSTIFCHFKIAH
ncbi:MAG: nitrilase-related carbon-nitrogen hydrolase, partial [Faecalibacillus sp.]